MDIEEDFLKLNVNDTLTDIPISYDIGESYTSQPVAPFYLILQEIIYAVVCLTGLVGNTLVIYVIARFSKMRTITNMYIFNLAIADACFLIGIPFLLVAMIKSSWIFGEIMCKSYLTLGCVSQFTGSIFVLVISADRYIAVCHPISSGRWRTPFISKCVSVAAWFYGIVLIIPILRYAEQIESWWPDENDQNRSVKLCVIVLADTSTGSSTEGQDRATTFILYIFLLSFAIPLCLTLVFYCLLILKLKTLSSRNKSREMQSSHRKVTILVLAVVTVYILCWLPYWVGQIAITFFPSTEDPSHFTVTIHLLTFCLSYSNSAINPILYVFLGNNFKKSFLKACSCGDKDINGTLQNDEHSGAITQISQLDVVLTPLTVQSSN